MQWASRGEETERFVFRRPHQQANRPGEPKLWRIKVRDKITGKVSMKTIPSVDLDRPEHEWPPLAATATRATAEAHALKLVEIARAQDAERASWRRSFVLVTTEHRGIFAGVLLRDDEAKRIVELKDARLCIRWSTETRGFLGLANHGPSSACRVGPAAPTLKLYGVTGVFKCTNKARKRWESEPWSND